MAKPKIRFNGYTEDWEQRKLGEVIEGVSKKNANGLYTQDDILACSLGTELDRKTIFYGLRSTEDSVKSYRIVNIGNVIYTKSPIKGYPNGIVRTCKIVDGIVPSLYCVYKKKENISIPIDTRFIQSYLEDKGRLDQYLCPLVNVGARNNVNITDKEFLEGIIKIPTTVEEQAKIVDVLEKINHLITLHQRKCEQTKTLKKYMLQKMFPQDGEKVPQIRFEGFTEDWEQRKVGELLEERNEQAPMSEDYPLMAFIANQGVAPKGERYDRSALVNDETGKKYKRTEFGDFIYSSNNLETGSIGLNKYGNACISPVYSIFKPTGKAELDFLGRRFLRKDFINEMVRWRQGVVYGQWKIHETDFMKIEVRIPSVDEQKKIGQYFDSLDNLITLHQRKCDELKEVKKFMLQNMFV